MSTYKRVSGNIVFETLTHNSSVSFIGPTANAVSLVIDGDLTVSGNASLTGNIAGDKIFNGTTSIEIPVAGGNANISVGGVSNVFVVAPSGISMAGNANITGNATVGNLEVTGIIGGDVTFGNISTPGNITISRDASIGQPTFRFNDTDTTLNISTVLGAVEWFTNDAAPGARVTTAVRSIATSATGNARYEVLTSTNGAAATAKFVIDDVGNVGVANTAPLHTFAVTGDTYVSGTTTAIGNITGGNVGTAGRITATGNIVSAGNIAGGNLAITANVVANNLSATTGITAGAGGITATGNIRGGNLVSDGVISATGNLTTTDIFATTLTASGNITGANLNLGGVANTNSVTAVTTVSAGGNVTGGNVNTAGQISAGGNVVGGNVSAVGLISAAGNVVAGAFFVGDGGFISNITIASNVAVTQLANGTSNWTIRGSGGNITGDVAGTANVVVITTDSMTVTGLVSATGNVTGSNITTAGIVSATGNINGGNINATIGNFNTVIGVANASNLTTGTVPSDRLTGIYTINIAGYSATVSASSQPNITSVGTLTTLSASGNITGGNLITAGQVSATGNVSGNFILGNGALLTGVITSVANINFGTSNVTVVSSGGNVTVGVGGTSNVVVFASTGAVVTGLISASGNITSGNLVTAGNITGGNLIISGAIVDSAQLDIQTSALNANIVLTPNGTGNVNIGRMSASGNITAVAYYGNGAPLTDLNATNISTGTLAQARLANSSLTVNGTAIALGGSGTITATATGTLTIGTGLGGTSYNGSTGVTITNTGVLSLANGGGITASVSTGAITLGSTATSANTVNAIVARDASGNFSAGTITATLSGAATSATTAGTVTTAAQPNITSVGTLTGLTVTNTITGSITGSAGSAGTATSATTAGTVTTAAQPNITSVGTLSSLSVGGNITGGNLITAGLASLSSITKTGTNGVGNIGAAGSAFDTVFARATSALYADLAEKFLADQPYAPGTVLVFGGEQEVTQSVTDQDHRVAGVVSTNPSYIMNSGLAGNYAVELALQGRVPCHVVGPVEKGDLLVSAPDGRARAVKSASAGTIIGKSLQNFSGTTGTIEIVVGRD